MKELHTFNSLRTHSHCVHTPSCGTRSALLIQLASLLAPSKWLFKSCYYYSEVQCRYNCLAHCSEKASLQSTVHATRAGGLLLAVAAVPGLLTLWLQNRAGDEVQCTVLTKSSQTGSKLATGWLASGTPHDAPAKLGAASRRSHQAHRQEPSSSGPSRAPVV
jgi:hypothetical protein